VARVLSTEGVRVSKEKRHIKTLVLVSDIHRETMQLVEFANSLGVPWTPVHVAVYPERVEAIQRKWKERIGIGELEIIDSPYRTLIRPLRAYVKNQLRNDPHSFVHVIMGELNTGNSISQILHQNAQRIEHAGLRDLEGVVTTTVPLQMEGFAENGEPSAKAQEVINEPEIEELVPAEPENAEAVKQSDKQEATN
jgi:hypothetical protein